jgi:hypothetical protein
MNIFGARKLDEMHVERIKALIDDKCPKFKEESEDIQTIIDVSHFILK